MISAMRATAIGLVLAAGLSNSAMAGSVPESNDPIKIAINEWTGQHLSAHILARLLSEMGYNVEFVTAGAIPQFAALADGTIHVQPEVWTNSVGEVYPKAIDSGAIEEIGLLGLNNREGWIYPKYMEETCPGLPKLEALIACKDALATADTFPEGRVITYPADWGTRSSDFIKAMNLPFKPIAGGSEGAMVAELKSAVTKKGPLVMMFWAPHWVLAEVDVGWVDIDPDFEAACLEDPAWGPNPNDVNDCDFAQADVTKAAWQGVKDNWPAAYRLLQHFELSGDDQAAMMLAVDQNGEDLDEVVTKWINENETKWRAWIENAAGA